MAARAVTRDRWIALAIGAVTIIITLLLLAMLETSSAPAPLQPETLSRYERRILELDRAAIDSAYQSQITHLFQTWMKDEQDQPKRALTGAKQARSAYERSIDGIVIREQRLQREQP